MDDAQNSKENEQLYIVEKNSNDNISQELRKLKMENEYLKRDIYSNAKLTNEYEGVERQLSGKPFHNSC